MAATSKKVYINKLPEIVDEYNNTTLRIIKLKSVDVQRDTYISFDVKFNAKKTKFNVCDHARISKYKNTFTKDYQPNWREEVFAIKNVKDTAPWAYLIENLFGEEIFGRFYE